MRKSLSVIGAIALLYFACAKGPAEAALKAADQAIAEARPEIEKFVPAELKALTESAKAAHQSFDKGDYKAALAAAQELPARVQAAVAAARRMKEQLIKAWNDFKAALPELLASLKARIEAFTSLKKLPKGIDAAQIDAARAELASIVEAWAAAGSAFEDGALAAAVAKATTLKTRVEAAIAGLPEPPPAKKK